MVCGVVCVDVRCCMLVCIDVLCCVRIYADVCCCMLAYVVYVVMCLRVFILVCGVL